jgi:hypothetical protein
VSVPLTSELRDYMYRAVGMVGAGIRVKVGRAEVAPRALFLYGKGGTIFDDREQEQRVIGGGLVVQCGVPFDFSALRVTPGIELGWLYVNRAIELSEYPFMGMTETQTGHVPLGGLFVRPEYFFGRERRVSVLLDLSAGMLLTRLGDQAVSTNFNTKLLGGIGHAF